MLPYVPHEVEGMDRPVVVVGDQESVGDGRDRHPAGPFDLPFGGKRQTLQFGV